MYCIAAAVYNSLHYRLLTMDKHSYCFPFERLTEVVLYKYIFAQAMCGPSDQDSSLWRSRDESIQRQMEEQKGGRSCNWFQLQKSGKDNTYSFILSSYPFIVNLPWFELQLSVKRQGGVGLNQIQGAAASHCCSYLYVLFLCNSFLKSRGRCEVTPQSVNIYTQHWEKKLFML